MLEVLDNLAIITLTAYIWDAATPLSITAVHPPLDTDIAQVLQEIGAVITAEITAGVDFVRCKVYQHLAQLFAVC